MSTFTATIFIETSMLSQERLACGLLAVTDSAYYFRWSKEKVRAAEQLSGEEYQGYFSEKLKALQKSFDTEARSLKLKGEELFTGLLGRDHFERLHRYNAGPVQFGDIKPHALQLAEEEFSELYRRVVNERAGHKKGSGSGLYRVVANRLQRPALKERADVDYQLPHAAIKGLVYPAKVDMITVNGSIQAVQTVDMSKAVDTVVKNLNEAEMIYHQLIKLGDTKKIGIQKLRLVFGPSRGSVITELFDRVRLEKQDIFDLISLEELMPYIEGVEKDPSHRKFSEFLV